jgi:DNA-binding LacI/PurR family transcriptional regulator
MGKVTIYEIAGKLNLSPATVSRAIHSPHLLNRVTLERIRRTMKESRYSYNAAAADFARGRSSTVNVFIPSPAGSVFSETVMGVQECAFRRFFNVVVSNTDYDSRREIELLKQAREQRCAGMLLAGFCRDNEEHVLELAAEGTPVVMMWDIGIKGMNSVGFDNYTVTRAVMEYLISLGHRRIGGVFGQYSLFHRVRRRLDAYLDALAEHGLDADPGLYSENRPCIEDGKKAAARLLGLKKPPTAVFCACDLQAVGAYDVIRKSGLRIPEDISVFGFDDIELAPYLSPALSTVHVPSYEIGRLSANLLLDMLDGTGKRVVRHVVDTPLQLRDSCAPPLRNPETTRNGACPGTRGGKRRTRSASGHTARGASGAIPPAA